MKRRILITGAAGFIGSHTTNALIKKGFTNIFAVDDLSGGFKENLDKRAHFTQLDLRDKSRTASYIQKIKPELIFHFAADATEGRSQFTPISCTERNYLAYLNVLIPAIKYGTRKIILASSMSVYGSQKPPFSEDMPRRPQDIYGISKAAMEQVTEVMSKVYDLPFVIIRLHNVYGPLQNLSDPYRNVVAIFINCLLQNKHFFIYGNGEQKRAFTYIDDCTPYIIKAAFLKKSERQILNIGPTKEFTINQLAATILKNFFGHTNVPSRLKPKYIPDRPLEVKYAWTTVDKARKLLGYKTSVSLEEGIKRTILWAKKIGPRQFKYNAKMELTNQKTPKIWVGKKIG